MGDSEVDYPALILQYQLENEELRRKLAFLFMRQRSLLAHFKESVRNAYRTWRAKHTEDEFQLALFLLISLVSLLIQIIRKKFGL